MVNLKPYIPRRTFLNNAVSSAPKAKPERRSADPYSHCIAFGNHYFESSDVGVSAWIDAIHVTTGRNTRLALNTRHPAVSQSAETAANEASGNDTRERPTAKRPRGRPWLSAALSRALYSAASRSCCTLSFLCRANSAAEGVRVQHAVAGSFLLQLVAECYGFYVIAAQRPA